MTRKPLLLLLLLPALAACGTPQEQCIRRNTHEQRVVSELLAETEGNLARGYAWEEREVTRTQWDQCRSVVPDKDGKPVVIWTSCLRDVVDTERYRVPIDPLTEQRKRDNLFERKQVLTHQSAEVVRQCRAAFPEES